MSEQEIIDNWLNMRQQQPVQLATHEAYWQHYRIKAAIAAMQGMLANPEHHKIQVESGVPFSNFYAVNARLCADALVAELQKQQD